MIITKSQGMNKIIDRIYIGNYQSADMLNYRNPEGITHVLNCTPDAHRGLRDFDVRQLDIDDGFEIPVDIIRFAISTIADAIHAKGKILVHCHAGVSRSVSLVCAYLMSCGFSWDDALQFVRARRSQAFPHPNIERSIKHYFGNYINSKTTLLGS